MHHWCISSTIYFTGDRNSHKLLWAYVCVYLTFTHCRAVSYIAVSFNLTVHILFIIHGRTYEVAAESWHFRQINACVLHEMVVSVSPFYHIYMKLLINWYHYPQLSWKQLHSSRAIDWIIIIFEILTECSKSALTTVASLKDVQLSKVERNVASLKDVQLSKVERKVQDEHES